MTALEDATDVQIMGIDEALVEDECMAQIRSIASHDAFDGPIRIMPDTHQGKGSVIGFTMPLGERVVPNTIGVDIGCGMEAACLGSDLPVDGAELDDSIRARIPMGFGPEGLQAPERDYYHVNDDFPWERANDALESFVDGSDDHERGYIPEMAAFLDDGGYDIEYFKRLCEKRAGRVSSYFTTRTAISSVGTLGSGNHFVEIGQSTETGDYWVVIHSGSRGLGANTCEYWQQKANRIHDGRADRAREHLSQYPARYLSFDLESVSDADLLEWLQGGKGRDFVDYEELKSEFLETDPSRIEELSAELKEAVPDPDSPVGGSDLDYLEDEAAAGYLIDMIFCQQYAAENRRVMTRAVADVLDLEIYEEITSTHNFVDVRDHVIRKGATRSYEGERAIVPFNMRDGILICEGASNPEWNCSVAHGAGRVMSRTQANREFDEAEIHDQLREEGIHSSVVPTDEAPGAYKDSDLIEEAISETATVVDRLEVVHNLKAP